MIDNVKTVEASTDIQYEYVRCAVCEGDDVILKYRITPRDSKLAQVWIGKVAYPVGADHVIVKCRTCGLVYVNPRLVPGLGASTYSFEEEVAYFEQSRAARHRAYTRLVEQLSGWLQRPPTTLLDIGCGDGVLIEAARQAGIEAVGSEASQALADLVRHKLGGDVLVPADLSGLPPQHYDVIALINVLEHLSDPQVVLAATQALLKPDGLLIVHVPNLGGLPARLRGARWHQIEPLAHFYYYTAATLKKLLYKAGYEPGERFSLATFSGLRGAAQTMFDRLGLHIDNGLGLVARKAKSRID
jgi:2-polyprenyl-3-methyl-5-hydroxy-6-metoxy-1,4-benzoquinol methylase